MRPYKYWEEKKALEALKLDGIILLLVVMELNIDRPKLETCSLNAGLYYVTSRIYSIVHDSRVPSEGCELSPIRYTYQILW